MKPAPPPLEALVETRGWPDRLVIALEQSLFGGTEGAAYRAEAAEPATSRPTLCGLGYEA
ncbi:MAG TPA: hypothetical protein QGF58_15330 [Myxococcota bacterium]|nr:hypothetical protein [Myxococcota bacterium]